MKIIKLFPVKIVITIKLFLIDNFVFYKRRSFQVLGQFWRLFKEANKRRLRFYVERKGEKKKSNYLGSKILSSSNMDTKNVTEEEKVICFYFQNLAM